jgi:hypothetical protein
MNQADTGWMLVSTALGLGPQATTRASDSILSQHGEEADVHSEEL